MPEYKLWVQRFQIGLLIAFLVMNVFVGNTFLQLVHFRALSGWEDEMAFDSLLFDWNFFRGISLFLNAAALSAVFLSFFVGDIYRIYGWMIALVFLVDAVYPWGLAFHYVRTFHFILLLGILGNGYGFLALAFLKRKLGFLENVPEKSETDG